MKIDEVYPEAYRLAKRFHKLYEQAAPAFGYKTSEATKKFDPESPNGRLMAWVCFEIIKEELQKEIGNMWLCKKCREKSCVLLEKLELF